MGARAAADSSARPRGVTIRTGVPFFPAGPASTTSNGPTANAISEDGNGRVAPNTTRFIPFRSTLSLKARVLAKATCLRLTCSVNCQGVL